MLVTGRCDGTIDVQLAKDGRLGRRRQCQLVRDSMRTVTIIALLALFCQAGKCSPVSIIIIVVTHIA